MQWHPHVRGGVYIALAPRAINNSVLSLEAPGEPRLSSLAGVCALSEKPLPFQLPVPHGQHAHPTVSQLREKPVYFSVPKALQSP